MGFNSREPQRVFALQKADDKKVYSYGVGMYVGDLPAPWSRSEPDDGTRAMIIQAIEGEDSREEPFAIGMIDWSVEKGHLTEEQAVEAKAKAYADREIERARPLEERIKESYELINKNPCINLDSGDTVWGAQCWWGPEDRMDEKIQGREIVIVAVPAGNPRWS